MNKFKLIIYTTSILIVLAIVASAYNYTTDKSSATENPTKTYSGEHDGIYIVDGDKIELINGVYNIDPVPGSNSSTEFRYFGNEVKADLDGDSTIDSAFLITKQSGGSGTFYYLVARLNKDAGVVGSDAVFIGDRISPQSTNIVRDKVIVVNFADRKPEDSYSTPPSVGKSLYFKLDPDTMQFGQVANDFEGEADTSRMNLGMKKWTWIDIVNSNEKYSIPKDRFTITFKDKNIFSATTDCNGLGGNYETDGDNIIFKDMISTLMFCEGSIESKFSKLLSDAEKYEFNSKGELLIMTKETQEVMILR